MNIKYLIQCLRMSLVVVAVAAATGRSNAFSYYVLLSIYAILSITNIFTDLLFVFPSPHPPASSLCGSGAGPTFPGQAELGVLLVVDLKQAVPQMTRTQEVECQPPTTTAPTADEAEERAGAVHQSVCMSSCGSRSSHPLHAES